MGNSDIGKKIFSSPKYYPYLAIVAIICLITIGLQISLLIAVEQNHTNVENHLQVEIIVATIIILIVLLGIGLVWMIRSRKLATEALHSKSDELERFFANSIDMLCIADTDGFFCRLNPEWGKTLGYEISEMEGKRFIEFVHPDDVESTIKVILQLSNNQKVLNFTNRYRHKDESYRWIEWRSFSAGNLIYASARDVTEKKRTEQELVESIDRAKTFLEASYEGIVISYEGRVVEVNHQFLSILGYSDTNEIIGKSILDDFTPPESLNIVKEHLLTNTTDCYEATIYGKDTSIIPVEIRGSSIVYNGKPMRVTTIRNLTNQKRIEQEMRLNDFWLRESQRHSHIGSYNYNIITGTWKSSEELDTIFGISSDYDKNIEGWLKFIHPEHQQEMANHLLEYVIQQHNTFDKEYRIVRQNDGEIRWVHGLGYLNFDNEGNPIQMIGTIADITDRRKSEEALRQSEQKYRLLFENMTSGFALHQMIFDDQGNPVDYKYIEANPAFERLTGLSINMLIGHSGKEIMHNLEDHWIQTFGRVAATGEPISYLNYAQDLGKYYDTYVFSPEKDKFAVVFNDVTDRVKAENNLKISEEKFYLAFKTSPDSININRLSDGLYLEINKGFTLITGYTSEDVVGKTSLELNIWANPEDRARLINELQQSGEITNLEAKFCKKNGEILIGLMSAVIIDLQGEKCLLSITRDITERKKAEEALSNTYEMLKVMLETIPVAMFDLDTQGNIKSIWNPAAEQLLGFTKEEAIGNYLPTVSPDKEDEFNHFLATIQEGKTIHGIDVERKKKGGEPISYSIYAAPLYNRDKEIVGNIAALVDITERKRMLREMQTLNETLEKKVWERTEQLQQSNNDLESFAYSVSHDLRAPLRHINGFVRLMYSKIDTLNPQITDYFEKIEVSTKRMSNMIDDLLSFSRLGRRELISSAVDLNFVLKEIIEQLKPDIENRKISWEIAKLPKVRGDKNLLKMAFENLISNAIKYTSRKQKALIEIGVTEVLNNQIEVFVKDNGVGFNMAYADRLFGVFQRLHSSEEFEGTGIGLANVKQIVLKHNGTIRAEGKLNEGAIFYITLPKID